MNCKTSYTPELAEEICERLAAGQSLNGICKDAHMPDETTVRHWVLENRSGFTARYHVAREIQADTLAEAIVDISDDTFDPVAPEDRAQRTRDDIFGKVQRDRLRIDARKWFASKVAPKKYGERVMNEHTGADGKPLEIRWAMLPSEAIPDPSAKS